MFLFSPDPVSICFIPAAVGRESQDFGGRSLSAFWVSGSVDLLKKFERQAQCRSSRSPSPPALISCSESCSSLKAGARPQRAT